MVTLKIGTCSDAENRLDKSPTFPNELVLSGTLKNNTSILDPVILVETSTNLSGNNYAYIQEFNRYYYIKDMIVVGASLWELHMHVDVLKTYCNGIVAAPSIISKSANTFNMYLNDPMYKCYQDNHVIVRNFPSGFPIEDSRFVLTVLGDKEWSE